MLYLQGAGTLFPAQLQVGDGTGEEGVTALGHTLGQVQPSAWKQLPVSIGAEYVHIRWIVWWVSIGFLPSAN